MSKYISLFISLCTNIVKLLVKSTIEMIYVSSFLIYTLATSKPLYLRSTSRLYLWTSKRCVSDLEKKSDERVIQKSMTSCSAVTRLAWNALLCLHLWLHVSPNIRSFNINKKISVPAWDSQMHKHGEEQSVTPQMSGDAQQMRHEGDWKALLLRSQWDVYLCHVLKYVCGWSIHDQTNSISFI